MLKKVSTDLYCRAILNFPLNTLPSDDTDFSLLILRIRVLPINCDAVGCTADFRTPSKRTSIAPICGQIFTFTQFTRFKILTIPKCEELSKSPGGRRDKETGSLQVKIQYRVLPLSLRLRLGYLKYVGLFLEPIMNVFVPLYFSVHMHL